MDPDEKMIFSATIVLATIIVAGLLILATGHWVKRGEASWYSNQEAGQITASGERFHDQELTAASWDWPFGTCLQIQNQANHKTVAVRINDRGPAKRLYKKGRKIDLSIGAFERIADPKEGIIRVKISKTSRENCDDKKTSK